MAGEGWVATGPAPGDSSWSHRSSSVGDQPTGMKQLTCLVPDTCDPWVLRSLWVGREGQADWERVEFSALRSHCDYLADALEQGPDPNGNQLEEPWTIIRRGDHVGEVDTGLTIHESQLRYHLGFVLAIGGFLPRGSADFARVEDLLRRCREVGVEPTDLWVQQTFNYERDGCVARGRRLMDGVAGASTPRMRYAIGDCSIEPIPQLEPKICTRDRWTRPSRIPIDPHADPIAPLVAMDDQLGVRWQRSAARSRLPGRPSGPYGRPGRRRGRPASRS